MARVLRITILAVITGCLVCKPDISIINGSDTPICGSTTKVTCNVTSNSFIAMFWFVNGINMRQCDTSACYSTGVTLPNNYILSNTGQTFYLEINPVTFDDHSNVSCTDGVESDTIRISPKTQITNATLNRTESMAGNKVTVTIVSNCVEMTSGVTFELTKQKSTEQQFVQDTVLTPIKTTIPCTNNENPDCGGNQTSRVSIVTNIQNDSTGDVYTFRLKVSYDGSDSWITLGTYTLANLHTTQTTMGVLSSFSTSSVTKTTSVSWSSTGSSVKQPATTLNEPYIYLIVCAVLLMVVILACVIYFGGIIYRQKTKTLNT